MPLQIQGQGREILEIQVLKIKAATTSIPIITVNSDGVPAEIRATYGIINEQLQPATIN